MKKLLLSAALAAISTLSLSANTEKTPQIHRKFSEVSLNSITSEGWLKTYFERQKDGLGGKPHMSGYPFDTEMFKENIEKPKGHFGQKWWPYEQTGYYLDGILRAGYLINDKELINIVRENIKSVIENPGEDNILGPAENSDWSRVVFFRALMAEYDASQNPKILVAFFIGDLSTKELVWVFDN